MIPSRKCDHDEICVLWDDLDAEQTSTTLFVPDARPTYSGAFTAARPARPAARPARPAARPVRPVRPVPRGPAEPIELSDADFETVRFVPHDSDPCRAFERLFAEEHVETIARAPAPRLVQRYRPPLAIDPMAATLEALAPRFPTMRPPSMPDALAQAEPRKPAPVTWQRPRAAVAPGARPASPSLIPWATLLMTLVVAAGLFADEVKSGTLGAVVDVIASFVDAAPKER